MSASLYVRDGAEIEALGRRHDEQTDSTGHTYPATGMVHVRLGDDALTLTVAQAEQLRVALDGALGELAGGTT